MEGSVLKIEDFRRLYATLVGRVDDIITFLEDMVEQKNCDWIHVMHAVELLKAALLEAEEHYIEAAERAPEQRLIVLPPREQL